MRPHPADIPLQQVAVRHMRRPGTPWAFAMWMAVSAAIALGAGVVLGILAALEKGYGLERWTQSAQAHGRLQLFAFAGVFIVALSFEFLARMNGRPPFRAALRFGVPAALGGGGILQAAGQVWYGQIAFLGPIGGAMMLAGAAVFAVTIARVKPPQRLRDDPQPWFFWLAGAWLVSASAMALAVSLTWEGGASLPVETHAVSEVFLRGFVFQVILAVGPRAFRGHLGLPALGARRQLVLLGTLNVSTLAWLAAQDVWVLPGVEWLARVADVTLALSVLALTVWLRIFSNLAPRFRGERYEWLIPIAWLGAPIWAVTLLVVRLAPDSRDLSLYQEGAIRHIFLLGFVLPLMIAMAHIVLVRFGAGYIPGENLLTAAFLALIAAWPLRVLPALGDGAPGDFARGLMGLAGLLTMLALGLTVVVCARTALATGRPLKQILRAGP